MTEFRPGELFAYVRGDSRRRVMIGVAAELREKAREHEEDCTLGNPPEQCIVKSNYAKLFREWADRLEIAADELHMELGQVKSEAKDGSAYRCWYSTGDTASCTPVENMHKFENAWWSHVERDGEDNWCENRSDGVCGDWECSKCGCVVEDGIRGVDWFSQCPGCGRFVR